MFRDNSLFHNSEIAYSKTHFNICRWKVRQINLRLPLPLHYHCTVASWLVRSTPELAVRVRALAGDIVLRSWARHFTLTVPLSTQVYKWVLANCWGNLTKLRGSAMRWTSIPSRGSRNTSSRFVLQKPGEAPAAMSQPGSKASLLPRHLYWNEKSGHS